MMYLGPARLAILFGFLGSRCLSSPVRKTVSLRSLAVSPPTPESSSHSWGHPSDPDDRSSSSASSTHSTQATQQTGSESDASFSTLPSASLRKHPRNADYNVFDTHFQKLNIGSNTPVEEIHEKGKDILARHDDNPQLSKRFKVLLVGAGVKHEDIETYHAMRIRGRNSLSKERSRQGLAKQRRNYANSKPTTMSARVAKTSAYQIRNKKHKTERKKLLDRELKDFQGKLAKENVHFGLTPLEYVRAEMPVRAQYNPYIYGRLDGELKRREGVSEAWQEEHKQHRETLRDGYRKYGLSHKQAIDRTEELAQNKSAANTPSSRTSTSTKREAKTVPGSNASSSKHSSPPSGAGAHREEQEPRPVNARLALPPWGEQKARSTRFQPAAGPAFPPVQPSTGPARGKRTLRKFSSLEKIRRGQTSQPAPPSPPFVLPPPKDHLSRKTFTGQVAREGDTIKQENHSTSSLDKGDEEHSVSSGHEVSSGIRLSPGKGKGQSEGVGGSGAVAGRPTVGAKRYRQPGENSGPNKVTRGQVATMTVAKQPRNDVSFTTCSEDHC